MRPTHWQTWEELMNGPTQVSLLNEATVDPEVIDFEVPVETAEDRRKGLRVIKGGKDAS